MIHAFIFWSVLSFCLALATAWLLFEYHQRLSPTERRLRALKPLSNGRRERRTW